MLCHRAKVDPVVGNYSLKKKNSQLHEKLAKSIFIVHRGESRNEANDGVSSFRVSTYTTC